MPLLNNNLLRYFLGLDVVGSVKSRHLRQLTLLVDHDLLDDDAEKLELVRAEVGHRALPELGRVIRTVELGAEDEERVLEPASAMLVRQDQQRKAK